MILHRLHWFVAFVGVGLLIVGVVGAAQSWNGEGLAFVFATGVVCLLLALVAHRLRDVSVEHSKGGVTKIRFA
ncbi:MAG: hypothetical protein ABJD24_15310, partial [Acidimicrobiales bacterium]